MVDGISLLMGITMGAGAASYLWGTRFVDKCRECKELTILKETSANSRWLELADRRINEYEELHKKYLELKEQLHDSDYDLNYKTEFYDNWSAKKEQADTVNRIKAQEMVFGKRKPVSQRVRDIQDIDLDEELDGEEFEDDEIEDIEDAEEEDTAVLYDPPAAVKKDSNGRMEAADGFPWPEKRKYMAWAICNGLRTVPEVKKAFMNMGYDLNPKTLANHMSKARKEMEGAEFGLYESMETGERVKAPKYLSVKDETGRSVCLCDDNYFLTTLACE